MLRSSVADRQRTLAAPAPVLRAITVALVLIFAGPLRADDEKATGDGPESKPVTEQSDTIPASTPKFRTVRLRGKVVWMAEGLKDTFGISTVPEVSENVLALRTTGGELLPIVENVRGRAFRKDKRLRSKQVEVLVRRYDQQPMIQVVRVYQPDGKSLYELDYWCDVCAIVMFEDGPCACCQDHNRLRLRLVDESGETTSTEKKAE